MKDLERNLHLITTCSSHYKDRRKEKINASDNGTSNVVRIFFEKSLGSGI